MIINGREALPVIDERSGKTQLRFLDNMQEITSDELTDEQMSELTLELANNAPSQIIRQTDEPHQ